MGKTNIRDTVWDRELTIAERLCSHGYRRLNQEGERLLIKNYTNDTFEVSWDGTDIETLVSSCIKADPERLSSVYQ
jgi:hypothetical protein